MNSSHLRSLESVNSEKPDESLLNTFEPRGTHHHGWSAKFGSWRLENMACVEVSGAADCRSVGEPFGSAVDAWVIETSSQALHPAEWSG